MGTRADSIATRSRAFVASSQGRRRRDSDPLLSIGKAGVGPIVAGAELLRSSGKRPHLPYAVSAPPGYGAWRFALRCEGIADSAARCPTYRPDAACALSLQRHESDGDAAGRIHQAADLDQRLGLQLAERVSLQNSAGASEGHADRHGIYVR